MDGMKSWPVEAIQLIKKQQQEIEKLKKRLNELENKLRQYENPHTPPSQRRFKGGFRVNTGYNKRGAPQGHYGATRQVSEPDEVISITSKECPFCGGDPGESKEIVTSFIEELPPPRKIKVIKYEFHRYECPCCGQSFTTSHKDCPSEGVFGFNVLTNITMLKYHLRGVLRRIQDYLNYLWGLKISVTGIHDVLFRVGDACKNEYLRILNRVKKADWRYTDETGFHVNGEKWWLWNFRTDSNESLVIFRKSRGRKVLHEILGEKNICGANVTDGWRAYNYLENVQRCWAHLIREVDDHQGISIQGKRLSDEIHRKYNRLKDFLVKNPAMNERLRQKDIWDQEMKDLVDEYSCYKELRKPLKYIKFGLGCWYTCLVYPGMEPTNNLGEQAIREHVVIRKIIGTFRSRHGCENYQYIASLFATWRLQKKNVFDELDKLLRRELSLS
jgi:transposase